MLAYYTSLVKREEIVKKLSDDGNNLASLANDLVCELKVFTSACNNRDVETCLESLSKACELSKIVSAMITNVEGNYKSYVTSLVPQETKEEKKQDELQINDEPETKEKDILNIMDAIRSLREMKESLNEK